MLQRMSDSEEECPELVAEEEEGEEEAKVPVTVISGQLGSGAPSPPLLLHPSPRQDHPTHAHPDHATWQEDRSHPQ